MKTLIAFIALASFALVGCNKDDVNMSETPAASTSAAPVQKNGGAPADASKAQDMMAAPPGVKTGTP